MNQAHALIFGFVQGVGYRHFIRSKANELGLTGWVKNLPDGSVEAVFQGDKSSIDKVIEHCKKGPFLSEVEGVEVQWESMVDNFKDFMVF